MRNWEKNFRQADPYVPGEQPALSHDIIKLNTNECPYPPAPAVKAALEGLDAGRMRLYPDYKAEELTSCLADYYHLGKNQVFVGVGSDDVLSVAFLTFFHSDRPILFPDITYSFYDVWARLYQIPYECPALDEDFRIRREDYYKENGGIIIANPNAPTSIGEGLDLIEDILEHNQDSVMIVDEAYVDFGGASAVPLLEKYENLLVVQTFSKSRAMAGMRIGYAMGHPSLIAAMNRVKHSINSYTMNYPALVCGVCAVQEDAYFKECCRKVIETREYTKRELEKIGFTCLDSRTNFLFVTHLTLPAKRIFEALRVRNILVRYFEKPRLEEYLRITIGTPEQMRELVDFLRTYLIKAYLR